MSIILNTEDANEATAAPSNKIKIIGDYSGDAPRAVVIDDEGNQTPLGGGEGGSGLPVFGSSVGDFSKDDLGRILQVQKYLDSSENDAYSAFWSGLSLPILNRVTGDEDNGALGAEGSDMPSPGDVMTYSQVEGAPRIRWEPIDNALELDAGCLTISSLYYSRLYGILGSEPTRNKDEVVNNLALAACSSVLLAEADDGTFDASLLDDSVRGLVTIKPDGKYHFATNAPGEEAIGYFVGSGSDGGAIYFADGTKAAYVQYSGAQPSPGDVLFLSDTIPGGVMSSPPSTGTKQSVGKCIYANSGRAMFIMRLRSPEAV